MQPQSLYGVLSNNLIRVALENNHVEEGKAKALNFQDWQQVSMYGVLLLQGLGTSFQKILKLDAVRWYLEQILCDMVDNCLVLKLSGKLFMNHMMTNHKQLHQHLLLSNVCNCLLTQLQSKTLPPNCILQHQAP